MTLDFSSRIPHSEELGFGAGDPGEKEELHRCTSTERSINGPPSVEANTFAFQSLELLAWTRRLQERSSMGYNALHADPAPDPAYCTGMKRKHPPKPPLLHVAGNLLAFEEGVSRLARLIRVEVVVPTLSRRRRDLA